MNNANRLGFCALGLLVLLGAGCAGGVAPEVKVQDTVTAPVVIPAVPSGKMKAEIPLSETGGNLLTAQKDYREFRFAGLTGSCNDRGLTDNVSLIDVGGSYVMRDNHGNFEDDMQTVTANQVVFNAMTLDQEFIRCTADVPAGSDTAKLSCLNEGRMEFCTGVYNVTAIPR